MFENALSAEAVQEALEILQHEFPLALWETVYVTLLSTAFAIVLGLPLGILLVAGEPQGVLPLPKWLMRALNVLINLLRSVPFLILMILLIPLTRAIVGTPVGTVASIVPLVAAAFPFVARLAESSLRELTLWRPLRAWEPPPCKSSVRLCSPRACPACCPTASSP